jgi:hypothetical protein
VGWLCSFFKNHPSRVLHDHVRNPPFSTCSTPPTRYSDPPCSALMRRKPTTSA